MNGRAQPHSVESERAVLGAVLLRPSVWPQIEDLLSAPDFFHEHHRLIFEALAAMTARSVAIDVVTLEAELQARGTLGAIGGIGGIVYLGEMQASVATAENVEHYARRVLDLATLRELIAAGADLAERAARPIENAAELVEAAEARLFAIGSRTHRGAAPQPIQALLKRTYKAASERDERAQGTEAGVLTGISTGFPELDRCTCGIQVGEVFTLGARPGFGKTAWAVNLASTAGLDHRIPTLIFSLEMSAEALCERLVCSRGSVDSMRSRAGTLGRDGWEAYTDASGRLHHSTIWIDDDPDLTVRALRSKARRWRAELPRVNGAPPALALVVIDYLQLVKPHREDVHREQQVAHVSQQLKAMAGELKVAVVSLAQINRRAEDREGPPRLSDLRESGAVEQDADVVAFLHQRTRGDDDTEPGDPVDLIVAKQRNGPTGTVHMRFLRQFTRFVPAKHAPTEELPPSQPRRSRRGGFMRDPEAS